MLRLLQKSADIVVGAWPRRRPDAAALARSQIVAHRGHSDRNRGILENTLAAFDACQQAGLWGIEFDLQWTRDGEPVVSHDPSASRVFGVRDVDIAELTRTELQHRCPEIPSFEEVLHRYGGRMHLMIEIKRDTFHAGCVGRLRYLLRDLQPQQDYHLISLQPALFDVIDFVPLATMLPVAETNTRALLELTFSKGYGGLTGHHLLLNANMRQRLRERGMAWGTGFVDSPRILARELNLGTPWLFSDRALDLRRYVSANTVC